MQVYLKPVLAVQIKLEISRLNGKFYFLKSKHYGYQTFIKYLGVAPIAKILVSYSLNFLHRSTDNDVGFPGLFQHGRL